MPFTITAFLIQLAIALAMQAVTMVISALTAPAPRNARPSGLSDFDIPTAEEGRPVPVIFGSPLVTGPNVVWAGDLRTQPIKAKGGKK
ncbi:MAG: hypothetical protein Tsb0020_48200 [Haliangiales bacterium]